MMHKLLENHLYDSFPLLSKNFTDFAGQPIDADSFSISTGNGWYPILFLTFSKLEDCIKHRSSVLQIRDIKEKYSSLSFLYDANDECIDTIIDEAEVASTGFCETCGRLRVRKNRVYSSGCKFCVSLAQRESEDVLIGRILRLALQVQMNN